MSRAAPPGPFASSSSGTARSGSSAGFATHEAGSVRGRDVGQGRSMSATAGEIARGQGLPHRGGRGPLDRFLNLFADVRPGEGVTVTLLMLNLFILLAGYYLLKTI